MSFFNYFSTGLKNTLKFKNSPALSYKGSVIIVTPDVVVDSWSVGDFSSATYEIAIEYGAHDIEHVNVVVTARVNQASITVYGNTNLGKDLVVFTATADSATVRLIANSYTDGTTSLQGIRLIVKATYAERILPLQVPSLVGPSSNTGGQSGVLESWTNSNLPDGFLALNEFGSVTISALSSVQVAGQSTLSADFIFSKLNIQNTDSEIKLTLDPVTSTLYVSISSVANLIVTHQLTVSSTLNDSSIDNIAIGATSTQTGRFTQLSSTAATAFSSNNQQIVISPTGTGTVSISAGSFNNLIIGANYSTSASFTDLTSTGAVTFNQNQLVSITPTGTATIAPQTAGTINNVMFGTLTPASATFSTINLITLQTQGRYLITKSQLNTILLGASV